MTYPEPRYLGDGGEASATYRPTAAPAESRTRTARRRTTSRPVPRRTVCSVEAFYLEHDNLFADEG